MNILDDAPLDAATHAFAVELEIDNERDGDLVRELWETAPDKGDYGVPYAMVLCRDGKTETATLRASLARFNQPPEYGWRWTAEALAAHLLSDLCGITVAGWQYPPNRDVCPHGNAYAVEGGAVRWLGGECASCATDGQPDLFRVEDAPDRPG